MKKKVKNFKLQINCDTIYLLKYANFNKMEISDISVYKNGGLCNENSGSYG